MRLFDYNKAVSGIGINKFQLIIDVRIRARQLDEDGRTMSHRLHRDNAHAHKCGVNAMLLHFTAHSVREEAEETGDWPAL